MGTENLNCNDLKQQLIEEINEQSCEELLFSRNVKTGMFKLHNNKMYDVNKLLFDVVFPRDYPLKMYKVYEMYYDPDKKSPLSKTFCVNVNLLDYKNGLIIWLGTINNNYELIFERKDEENNTLYSYIENKTNLKKIEKDDFEASINDYNLGIGIQTDEILEKITFQLYKNNTRKITIPYDKNFNVEQIKSNTYIEFYPSICANKNLRFSLMMRLIDENISAKIITPDPDFKDIYYDNFCINPPDNC